MKNDEIIIEGLTIDDVEAMNSALYSDKNIDKLLYYQFEEPDITSDLTKLFDLNGSKEKSDNGR